MLNLTRINLIRDRMHLSRPLDRRLGQKVISTTPAKPLLRHLRREGKAEVFPERATETLDRVWMVAHWKWDLDPSTPWFRKFFFKYIFRRFIHFSWNVMKVPCPKGIEVNGKTQTIFWFENGGFFSSEAQANLACVDKWHGYKDVPMDRCFPPQSAQYSSLVFPRQKNPRQHRKAPSFNLVLKDRVQEERESKTLADALSYLNQVLDRR